MVNNRRAVVQNERPTSMTPALPDPPLMDQLAGTIISCLSRFSTNVLLSYAG